jgi:tRNA(Ile)-lysidine synthase
VEFILIRVILKFLSLLQDFKNFIATPVLQHAKFGVAVSGGIDSVVLCELCAQAGINFFIVHCNFKLRGGESERDEQFVRTLAKKYGVKILVKEFDTEKYAAENKLSIQVTARDLRYQWFSDLHRQDKNTYILLAHHANDDIETMMMNFFRGTGIEGLTGMPLLSYHYCLRPLLNNTRKQIQEFAAECHLSWVEDSSNQSSKYARNFFRNELMPMLKKVYPMVEENLLDNIRRFKSIDALYKIGVDKLKEEIFEKNASGVIIPIHKLKPYQHTSLIYEIIKDYGFGEKQVDEISKLMDSESGRYIENEFYQVIRHRKNLIITQKQSSVQTAAAIEKHTKQTRLAENDFSIRLYSIDNLKLNKAETVAQLDAGLVSFPLLIRKWKEGDYFYPLGLRKKKKLSRFFIDQKLSRTDKEKIWIVESESRIIWVAGLRIDDRFKITPSTKEVLELSISNL